MRFTVDNSNANCWVYVLPFLSIPIDLISTTFLTFSCKSISTYQICCFQYLRVFGHWFLYWSFAKLARLVAYLKTNTKAYWYFSLRQSFFSLNYGSEDVQWFRRNIWCGLPIRLVPISKRNYTDAAHVYNGPSTIHCFSRLWKSPMRSGTIQKGLLISSFYNISSL